MDATILVPTYNGEAHLSSILSAIDKQKTAKKYEILVIDSGSTDDTLSILESFAGQTSLRLHIIDNSDYGHGKTRNLGVSIAKGRYVVVLSHDAVPVGDDWLDRILEPFAVSDEVAAVFGRQSPRPQCCPIIKRDILNHFRSFGPNDGITLYRRAYALSDSVQTNDFISFYSDAFSALDKVQYPVPYEDVEYAEDQLFGERLVREGKIKAYAGNAVVEHSNDYSLAEYKKRMFDGYYGLLAIGKSINKVGPISIAKIVARGTLADWRFILKDPDYSISTKLYYGATTPAFNAYRHTSANKAVRYYSKGISRSASGHSLEKE